jgi:hypothetical protein
MNDPSGGHFRMTGTTGGVHTDHSAELDAFGIDAELHSPPTRDPHIPGMLPDYSHGQVRQRFAQLRT